MKAFTYRVGVPAEDGLFLQSGFSDPHRQAGAAWRNCAKQFRLDVPAAGRTRVTLRMRFVDPAFRLEISCGGRPAGAVVPAGEGWGDYAVEIDSAGPVATLTGRLDRDPYDPPAPKLQPNRAFVDLSAVTAEPVGPDELDVPEQRTRARIERAPLKLTNFHRSANKVRRPAPAGEERTVLFGDLHVHTNYSACGRPNNGTIEENVALAKQRGLDFLAITDHCEHMDRDIWERYFEEISACAGRYDIPILPATEWTSRDHGHRNLYFLDSRPPYLDYFLFETDRPAKLGAFFASRGLEAFAVPHHFPYVFQSGNIDSIAPDVEPLMEIYSHWGSSECYGARLQDTNRVLPGCTVTDALGRGLKLGFVGGGDVHNDAAGDGGLTAVLARDRSVESLFAALKGRLCYATSGDRILLDFHVNGFPTGSVLPVNPYSIDRLFPLSLSASAVCPTPVERMELICNGEVIYTTTHRAGRKAEMNLKLTIGKLATPAGRVNNLDQQLVNHSRYYYVRVVQNDGGMAWSSPIWIDFAFPRD